MPATATGNDKLFEDIYTIHTLVLALTYDCTPAALRIVNIIKMMVIIAEVLQVVQQAVQGEVQIMVLLVVQT